MSLPPANHLGPLDAVSEEPPPLAFQLDSSDTSGVSRRLLSGRSLISSVDGVAKDVDGARLWIGELGAEVVLRHTLPSSIDLAPLLGRRLRVTVAHETGAGGAGGQTLTLNTLDGRVWLIARHGSARGAVHAIGGRELRAALSQRPGGALVIGHPELQWLVAPGEHARIDSGDAKLAVLCLPQSGEGVAAYVIADEALVRAY